MEESGGGSKGKQSKKCFVVGPIGTDGSPERKHADLMLNAVIRSVLEAAEFSYVVKRADEDASPGMIGDMVITDVIHADLVVADLTDLNPNAFYELGIRHSAQKPTIHIAKVGTKLPFDNFAHRTIFIDVGDWHSLQASQTRLAEAARAIEKPGYQVSNPVTSANAQFTLRASGDPESGILADLMSRVSSLERSNSQLPTAFHPTSRGNDAEEGWQLLRMLLTDYPPMYSSDEFVALVGDLAHRLGVQYTMIQADDLSFSVSGVGWEFRVPRANKPSG